VHYGDAQGCFRFIRIPFGIKSAPEVYLQTMSELFGDLSGVVIYFDDFLVPCETTEELHFNLRQVLVWCRNTTSSSSSKSVNFS
jgi:hypothetical protein